MRLFRCDSTGLPVPKCAELLEKSDTSLGSLRHFLPEVRVTALLNTSTVFTPAKLKQLSFCHLGLVFNQSL